MHLATPFVTALLLVACSSSATTKKTSQHPPPVEPRDSRFLHGSEPAHEATVAYDWLEVVLETSARDVVRVGARPTILSRQMVIPITAMYDAWSAYDDKALPVGVPG